MTAIAAAISTTDHKMRYLMQGPKAMPGATIKVVKLVPTTYTTAGSTVDFQRYTKKITAISAASPSVITMGAAVPSGTSVRLYGTNSKPAIDGVYTSTYVGATSFSVPADLSAGTAGDLGTVVYGLFPNRIYWATLMTTTAKNATTGYIQPSLVPGTAKTDVQGGYDPATWKLQCAAGATETGSGANIAAYTIYAVVCGC